MDDLKLEHRSIIKFLSKESSSPRNILKRLVVEYEKSSPSYSKSNISACNSNRVRIPFRMI